jgi:hypothetical protein
MFLLQALIGIPGHDAARQGCVRGLFRDKRRPRPLLLERLENRLCLSAWSEPVNLGPIVNSSSDEAHAALSPDGLSLYFSSNRPGGFAPPGDYNIWVSQRASLNDPWGPAQNLGPTINYPGSHAYGCNFSPDGHRLFFESSLPGDYGGGDIYVSSRDDTHEDFGWQPPVNLGPGVNSPYLDVSPNYFEDGNTGITTLYFNSDRTQPGTGLIYASTLQDDGTFGAAVPVTELNSPYNDGRTAIRSDGLEMFLTSSRPGGIGTGRNIWVATRPSTLDAWSKPVNLGTPINLKGFDDAGPALSSDGNTMFFHANRRGGSGNFDLYMSTRLPLLADHFILSTSASTTAGQSVSVTLTAWDHYGNIATGYTGTVTFASSDPQATLPASYTFTAADNGTHTFDAAWGTAGAQSIKVTDPARVIIGARASIVVNPAPAVALFVSAPSSVTAGNSFTITVSAMDPYGNVDTNYTGTVTFTSSDAYPGVLPADYTFTAADNGTHTFAGVTLFSAGAQTLTTQDTANGSLTGSATVAVAAAPADHFLITAASTAISGTPFDVTVTALDPYGNVDTKYAGTTTWASSDADPGVVLPADYTFQANDNGTHTFLAGFTLITPGDQTLTATDTGSGITGNATVTVAPAPKPPPGGGASKPWMPSINTELSQENAGLLFARRRHEGAAADHLFAVD